MKVTLLTTSGCHLCEEASSQLEKLQKLKKIESIEEVEIIYSDKLTKKYGSSIPVVKIRDHELYWPFELRDLEIWIERLEVSSK